MTQLGYQYGFVAHTKAKAAEVQANFDKIRTFGAAGQLLLFDGSGVLAALTPSGDIAVGTDGELAVKDDKVTPNMLTGDIPKGKLLGGDAWHTYHEMTSKIRGGTGNQIRVPRADGSSTETGAGNSGPLPVVARVIDPDAIVTGAKLRLAAQVVCNGHGPGADIQIGLRRVTSVGGNDQDQLFYTVANVVFGEELVVPNPGANGIDFDGVTPEFDPPGSADLFTIAFKSTVQTDGQSLVGITAQLEVQPP